MFDVLIILMVALCVVWGFLRGGLRALLALAALTVAWVGSASLGPGLGTALGGMLRMGEAGRYIAGRVAAAVLIYISLRASGSILNRKLGTTRHGITRRWNRHLGLATGLLTGLLLAVCILLLAHVALRAFPDSQNRLLKAARRSRLRTAVGKIAAPPDSVAADVLRLLDVAREQPEALARLSEHPHVQRLLQHPDVREVLADQDLTAALQRGDLAAVLDNRKLAELLQNEELKRLLLAPETRQALRQAVRGEREARPAED